MGGAALHQRVLSWEGARREARDTGSPSLPTLRPTSPPLSPSACATRAGLELTHCLCLDLGTEAAYSDLLAPAVLV